MELSIPSLFPLTFNSLSIFLSLSLSLSLTSELQPSELKGHKAITNLNDVDKCVQLVIVEYKEIP